MPELPALSGNEVVAAFERCGFAVVRKTGSHHMMSRQGHRFVLAVPIHGKGTIKRGTLCSLIRAAGLTRDEFLQLLAD